MSRSTLLLALALLAACHQDEVTNSGKKTYPPNPQGTSVLTQHNANDRAGWNDKETLLTTSNVNVGQFGRLFSLAVDDQVYAQPLVIGKLAIKGGEHNVVYIATVNNTVYAYDGDDGTLYWKANYTASGMRPPRNTDMTGACGGGYADFSGNMGIVGTPVIDGANHVIYFVARSTSGSSYVQYLHAVDAVTGSEMAGSPVKITASVPGSGSGSVNGVVSFDAQKGNQRQALTLVNGIVYVTYASHCDWGPYHGWVLGYDKATLQQQVVWNTTPEGDAGGVWESGMGPVADDVGDLYMVTGNGTVGVAGDPASVVNRSESALKLRRNGSTMMVLSFFTPYDYQALNDADLDYGGMGALLAPGGTAYFTGAKNGNIYVLDKDQMGGFSPTADLAHQVVALGSNANMHCQAAYYPGGAGSSSATDWLYVWSENDALRAIPFNRALGQLEPSFQKTVASGGPTGQSGAVLSVSSNWVYPGTAILWAAYAYSGDAEHGVMPGILRAFDANDITHELWNNRMNAARDGAGNYAKFAAPTVANGHVYLPTFSNEVVVYGEL